MANYGLIVLILVVYVGTVFLIKAPYPYGIIAGIVAYVLAFLHLIFGYVLALSKIEYNDILHATTAFTTHTVEFNDIKGVSIYCITPFLLMLIVVQIKSHRLPLVFSIPRGLTSFYEARDKAACFVSELNAKLNEVR